jgi:hypothetical protein
MMVTLINVKSLNVSSLLKMSGELNTAQICIQISSVKPHTTTVSLVQMLGIVKISLSLP